YLFANRTQSVYVDCGTVTSNLIDVGSLATTESTVTSLRLAPSPSAPSPSDGTVTWEASNDDGVTWHPALPCSDDPTQYCVNFTTSAGSKVRWRATICSNTDGTFTDHTRSPEIDSVTTEYTYVTATNHFGAGPIARDGVIYVGAYRMPGSAGHVYAIDDQS